MKKSRFTATQIVSILKQQGDFLSRIFAGNTDCPKLLFTTGRAMEASDVRRLKDLEEENNQLKKMYADLALDNRILKDLFTKKGWALPQKDS